MFDSVTLHALILGILQGITEFLPVSSSAHLVIVSAIMDGKPLPLTLNIALHIGTVMAVLLYFHKDWLSLLSAAKERVFQKKSSFESDVLFPALIIGSLPAGIVGILWQDQIEQLFHNPKSVILPLVLVGILMWVIDAKASNNKKMTALTLKDAFIIGVAQACALVPGVSRSGSTIIGGRILGFKREEAARFSFLLGTPAMLGAALLNYKELLQSINDPVFYIGSIASMITGCLAIGFMLRFLKRFGLAAFAIYRIALAAVLAYLLF